MSYRFAPDDKTLRHALRRIAREELESAQAQFRDGPLLPAGVHDIRKRMKKLRGLLRLLRSGFPDVAAETAALGDVARLLSADRDAEVRLATLDRLFPLPPQPLTPLRLHLTQARAAPRHDDQAEAREALRALHKRARHWTLEGKDADILERGLARTRRRVTLAMELAAEHRAMEPMHLWRKRAKDYWYQTRLLAPVWPEAMGPLSVAASVLTEDLGQHHDLGVLIESAPQGVLDAEGQALLGQAVAEAQAGIEERVFPLGARMFAGDPEEMAKLWVRWWRVWRG